MKKLFTIVALAFCALTINAQTTLSFSEVKVCRFLGRTNPQQHGEQLHTLTDHY